MRRSRKKRRIPDVKDCWRPDRWHKCLAAAAYDEHGGGGGGSHWVRQSFAIDERGRSSWWPTEPANRSSIYETNTK